MKRLTSAGGIAAILLSAATLASCSPALTVTIAQNSSGKAKFTAETSASADALVRRFAGASSGATDSAPLFDRERITVSLAHAGLKAESVETPSKNALSIGVSFSRLDGILGKAVSLDAERKRVTVKLTKDVLNEALTLMPPDTDRYTDLLMAPIFTGETMDSSEYAETIAAAYGKTLAGDLRKSVFTLTIHCPGTVKKASATAPAKAETTGSVVVFRVPLADLLAPTEAFTAFAEW